MSDNEWRELGPDEIPQTGDQSYDGNLFEWVHIKYSTKEPASKFLFPIRTRRPLPKREAKPIDNEIVRLKEMIKEAAKRGDEMAEHWKERAEKAEALVKQLHHLAKLLPEASKTELPHTDSMSTSTDNLQMTTNNDSEVARLRELLSRAIGHIYQLYLDIDPSDYPEGHEYYKREIEDLEKLTRLAPAPEEPCKC